MVDGNGLPVAAKIGAANIHDIKFATETIDSFKIGQRIRRPKRLKADKAYDSDDFRKELWEKKIIPIISERKCRRKERPKTIAFNNHHKRYARQRWKVERSFAWIDSNKRLICFYERTKDSYDAFLRLAMIKCYLRRLIKRRKKYF